MRKIWFLSIFVFFAAFAYAQNVPQPQGYVNDFAGVISAEFQQKLNSLVQELAEKTSAEIAVVTVQSIAPYDEKDYARKLFDNWKPGKIGKDNGVLVLLAVKERRWRIEAGYGVEGILPDGLCGDIGRNYMVPYFKEGSYGEGLYQGTLKVAQIIAKEANVSLGGLDALRESPAENEFPAASFVFPIIVLIFILLPILFNRNRRSGYGTGYYGGSWGGGYGGSFGGGGFGGGGFGGGGGGGGGAGGGF